MKKMLTSLLVLVIPFIYVPTAYSHVLITDETNVRGAILHIIPDDDPIAGEQATLYFDAQDKLWDSKSEITLSIKDESGGSRNIPIKTDGSLATASYTFPSQGVYELTFSVRGNDKTYVFKQMQRVSRGATSSALDRPNFAWAEILLLTCVLAFALLMITAFNRRADIAKQSKW